MNNKEIPQINTSSQETSLVRTPYDNLTVTCKACNSKFGVGKSTNCSEIVHKRKFEVEGKTIFLTYYDCPHCSHRHFVQIDNDKSLELLQEVTLQMAKLMAKRQTSRKIPQKQSDKFQKTRRNLSLIRTTLKKEFTGKSLHDDETDEDFILSIA